MGLPPKKLACPRCGSEDVQRYGDIFVCFSCRASFPASKAAGSDKHMRLFISYGHPESLICERIMAALRDRGHQVWFDRTSIVHGQDWREQIADGIRQSDGVIACLSAHSVRDPGVSLDELSIAIGVRGGNIKTVLLGPEQDVRPPASMCHIQYLDMSQWRQFLTSDGTGFTPGFQAWFDRKMAQLIAVVESDDSRQFVGQISAIRNMLHVNYDTSKQQALLERGVVGRKWLTDQVDAWLDDPAGARLCVLYGEPGVGKSAFAARYIHYNPRVAAGLFCEYDRPIYNNARTVAMTLAYLLACRLPDYRLALMGILEQEKRLGALSAAELFDRLLATPLASLVIGGDHETLCIVIDGLDECAQGERNALAEVLAQYAPRLPSWLRILVMARDVSSVTGPLEGAFSMRLQADQAQNMEDVRQYLAGQLYAFRDEPDWSGALDALAERSGGIFLYAALAADAIRAGKVSLRDADAFPSGLGGIFYRWFGWFFPDQAEYESRFRSPLGMLLAAPAPLPTQELRRIFGWDENDLNDFLRRMKVLLRSGRDDFDKDTVVFSHQYLSQWLDSPEAERFRSSRSAAVRMMADRFYQLFRAAPTALIPYEAMYMLPLLAQAGQTARHDQMAASWDLFWALLRSRNQSRFQERLDTALQCSRQAVAVAERAAVRQPEKRNLLCTAWSNEAIVLELLGRLDQALALHSKTLSLAEQLAQEQGQTPESLSSVCEYTKNMAGILDTMGRHDQALSMYQQVLERRQQLLREQDTPSNRWHLSNAYNSVAGMLRRAGRTGEAIALYEQAMALINELLQEKDDPNYRRSLFFSCFGKAGALMKLGRPDQALPLYEQAVSLGQRQIQQTNVPMTRRELWNALECAGDALRIMGRLTEALAYYRRALPIAEKLVRELNAARDQRRRRVLEEKIAYTTRTPPNRR